MPCKQVLGGALLVLGWPLTGAGPVVNEFSARPRAGEGEWVELLNPGPEPWTLDGWTLADGTGRARRIPGPIRIPPRGFLLLAARPESLRAAFVVPDSVPVVKPSSWPILNDRDAGAGEPADRIVLADRDGHAVDSVAYFESWLPPEDGRSLERADPVRPGIAPGAWGWSLDPAGGTPGRANSLSGSPRSGDGVWNGPDRVHPSRAPAVYQFRLPGPGTMAIWLLDREGREVARLASPRPVPARGRWVWGQAAPGPSHAGLYLLCLRWQAEGHPPLRRCRRVWVEP
jgi:hypothetical protein